MGLVILTLTWKWSSDSISDTEIDSYGKDVDWDKYIKIQIFVKLTLTWKRSSDTWIDSNGKEVDRNDGCEEDEEAGDGSAGDEDDQFGIVEEIFDALQGHVCQTSDLTWKSWDIWYVQLCLPKYRWDEKMILVKNSTYKTRTFPKSSYVPILKI